MLEKIGLPAKPSMRGSSWVVDASHCQGCSSQFTFINRKHHCRRCGGIFCGSCTQQRMVLRGQGDSAVRICDPCKKLEEAARFEMRHGNKNRAGKGGSKLISKNEDEVLNQILGTDGKKPSISGRGSNSSMVPTLESGTSTASISNFVEETVRQGGKGDSPKISIFDTKNDVLEETKSSNPEELLQQAQEEKKKYKILKGEGKPEEALRAFKRGKELEREAKALEVALRKSQRKALSLKSVTSTQNANDDPEESDKKRKVSSQMGKERKDDLTAELRELGWSDADIHVADKNPVKISLEGELSSLIGEVHNGSGVGKGTGAINKTEVIALKKKALMFKKEGKLAEAKEELKRAKVLEQKLEEQEFLAGAEGSDDELSSLINSMDDDTHDSISLPYEQNSRFDFDHLVGVPDDLGPDGGFEVTDEDMNDPDIAATLNSLGWTDDLNNFDKTTEVPAPQSVSVNGKALLDKAESLKQDALRQKQCGNVEAAMALLRKANLLQKDAENVLSQGNNLVALSPTTPNILTHQTAEISDDGLVGAPKRGNAKLPTKSKIAIQKELLGHKKKERALRREGRTEEAEEESKKGRILESQLEEMENSFKVRPTGVTVGSKVSESVYETSSKGAMALGQEVEEEDVTEQDMYDPALLSQLEDIGWEDERETENSSSGPLKHVGNSSDHAGDSSLVRLPHSVAVVAPKRSKAEIQRELLGLKRKALTLRRQGDVEDAEEILRKAKVLEAQLADIEAPNRERPVQESQTMKPSQSRSGGTEEAEIGGLDPTPLSQLNKLGSNDEVDSAIKLSKHYEQSANHTEIPFLAPRSKSEIQRELLGLKRKALNLRRQGELGESEEVLRMASVLELQMNEMAVPDKDLQLDSTKDNDSDPVTSQPAELDPVVETRMMNLVDLLTDNDVQSSRSPIEEVENKSTTQNVASLRSSNIRPEASSSSSKEIGAKDAILYEKKGRTLSTNENSEANSVTVSSSQSNESNLQHEIQAHKRRALALKREGRSAEALEELRQAKLLERSGQQKDTTALPDAGVSDLSVSTSGPTPAVQEDRKMTPQAPKPMTSRDRFKLQQKSLGHKRQAMKLRREGRMEEAEAEFELAKALENQLEEPSGNDSSNLKKSVEVPGNDDLGVEDLLDPQLLAALKAIGLQDVASNPVVSSSARPEDAKPSIHKIETRSQDKSQTSVGVDESLSQEKSQLEERIKTEKVKAVTLKRAGKQAEALDALRRAKLYEKKLKSLA